MSSARPLIHARTPRRIIAVAALSLGLFGLTAVGAQAHVTLHADSSASGSFSQLTFRVPNESPKADTVEVAVQLPQDKPFLFVSAKPLPGWTVEIKEAPLPAPVESEGTTITKAARTVTWTAAKGNALRPKEYQDFSLSVGPLPAAGTLTMPALQTYSDGEVVAWNQPTPASGDEPESPAPTLEVVAATEGEATGEPAASSSPATSEDPAPVSASGPDTTARWLAGAALVVGIAAGALGALGLRRGTRRP